MARSRVRQATMYMKDSCRAALGAYAASLQLDSVTVMRVLIARDMRGGVHFSCAAGITAGPANEKLTLRLSDNQIHWISEIARRRDVTRSRYLNTLWQLEASARTIERYMEGR